MTKTDTRDIKATVSQIKGLEEAGCEIVRCAVPDLDAAKALKSIKQKVNTVSYTHLTLPTKRIV